MIDYLAHAGLLEELLKHFDNDVLPGDGQKLNARLMPATKDRPDLALLGSVVDHLVWHAGSDGSELEDLRTVSILWGRGIDLYARVSQVRADMEDSLKNPSDPASTQLFSDAYARFLGTQKDFEEVSTATQAAKAKLTDMPHLRRPHPRQESLPIADWSWGDRFLGRCTYEFIRQLPEDSDETRSLKAGVVASFLGNAAGSSLLAAVTGGPRRLHRFRDRLARNTLGTWVAQNQPSISLSTIAEVLSFGAATPDSAVLPPSIKHAIDEALQSAYPGMTALGDLDAGLQRLVDHVRLLDTFALPAAPAPLELYFLQQIPPSATVESQTKPQGSADVFGNGGPSPSPGVGTSEPTDADKSSASGSGCAELLIGALVFALVFIVDCFVQIGEGHKCSPVTTWEKLTGTNGGEQPPQNVGITTQTLTAVSGNGMGAQLLKNISEFQGAMWQGFDTARTFLATVGLIYPDSEQIDFPLFNQFIDAPNDPGWPHLEEQDPLTFYIFRPTTPTEVAKQPSQAEIRSPGRLFAGFRGLVDQALEHFESDPVSYDLDGDRGYAQPCWDLSPGGNIYDNPLPVSILAFDKL